MNIPSDNSGTTHGDVLRENYPNLRIVSVVATAKPDGSYPDDAINCGNAACGEFRGPPHAEGALTLAKRVRDQDGRWRGVSAVEGSHLAAKGRRVVQTLSNNGEPHHHVQVKPYNKVLHYQKGYEGGNTCVLYEMDQDVVADHFDASEFHVRKSQSEVASEMLAKARTKTGRSDAHRRGPAQAASLPVHSQQVRHNLQPRSAVSEANPSPYGLDYNYLATKRARAEARKALAPHKTKYAIAHMRDAPMMALLVVDFMIQIVC